MWPGKEPALNLLRVDGGDTHSTSNKKWLSDTEQMRTAVYLDVQESPLGKEDEG